MLCSTGAANIADAGQVSTARKDHDLVPEAALRPSTDNADYHTGRGGAGNEHLAPGKEHGAHEQHHGASHKGLADKLKHKLFASFGKKSGEASA